MSAPGGLFLKRQLMQNTFQRGSVFLLSDDPSTKQTWEGGGSHTADPVSVYETEAAPSHASPLEPSHGPPYSGETAEVIPEKKMTTAHLAFGPDTHTSLIMAV